jgi:hypothetical protein
MGRQFRLWQRFGIGVLPEGISLFDPFPGKLRWQGFEKGIPL